jgi:hypothetical protein
VLVLDPQTVLQSRYAIQQLLGQGGMGAIYEALDTRFGSTVAVKQTLFDDEVMRKAFVREARLLNQLKHAALPKVIDYFEEMRSAFLVMEFIPGQDLGELLAHTRKPFAVDRVLRWADQLLAALEYLHSREPAVVHRDIKPQNVKLTPEDDVILLDFGLAKGAPPTRTGSIESGSVRAGTPRYAPLEQMNGEGTDARCDVYSLGATLFTLLTAELPVDAGVRAAAHINRMSDPQPRANALNPDVPRDVGEVIASAMSLVRDERPASAAEMRRRLRAAAEGATVKVPERRGDEGRTPAPPPAPVTVSEPLVSRPINLGFGGAVESGVPHGWFNGEFFVSNVSTAYRIDVVPRPDRPGRMCVALSKGDARPGEFGVLMQRCPARFVAGHAVRIEADLATESVTHRAGLWLRGDAKGKPNVVFDNMERRPVRGTTAWTRYSIEAQLPHDVAWLNYGIVLVGAGRLWVSDVELRVWRDDRWEPV